MTNHKKKPPKKLGLQKREKPQKVDITFEQLLDLAIKTPSPRKKPA